jgi:hypothetical protein
MLGYSSWIFLPVMLRAHFNPGEHGLFLVFQATMQVAVDLQVEFPKIIRKSA